MQAGDCALASPSYQRFVLYPLLQGYSNLLGNRKDFVISYVLDTMLDNNTFMGLDHSNSLDPARFELMALAICVGSKCVAIWATVLQFWFSVLLFILSIDLHLFLRIVMTIFPLKNHLLFFASVMVERKKERKRKKERVTARPVIIYLVIIRLLTKSQKTWNVY